ncbi:MAG: FAD-dependent oxidoreductase [Acidimicrobiia bacterium]
MKTVIVGGGAGGIGSAGAARAADPSGQVVVYTEYEDAAYSPCGIPYVHGKEIPDFERLFLAGKEAYVSAGIDIRYSTKVTGIDVARKVVTVEGEGEVSWDKLIIATGFDYADPGVPGTHLGGLYYVKNIRRAMEWDKVLDETKTAVVVEASPLGLEMVTALPHRGIETHLIDPHPWALSEAADPDIAGPVEDSWAEMGVKMHFNTDLEAFLDNGRGQVRGVRTSAGELPADLVVVCTKKVPRNDLAAAAGIEIGSTGGIVVDERMATSAPDVFAAGDCIEVPHGVANIPLQGLSGSHAYSQGKVAGTNAGGGQRAYQPVYVPWGMVAGKWMIGGVAFGETLALALGIPHVVGIAETPTAARYYADRKPLRVKLLADPESLRLIGAQMVGGEGIKERSDFLAMAVKIGASLRDVANLDNVYAPSLGMVEEPIVMAARNALAELGAGAGA